MDKLLDQIFCKVHGKAYLELNSKTYQISCKMCISESKIDNDPGISNLEIRNSNEESKEEVFCFKHKADEALYFCSDCREFICKTCFPTDHRSHNCSTPELIVPIVKTNLSKLLKELSTLKKSVEENMTEITDLNNFFVNTKSDFQKNLNDINNRFLESLKLKTNEFNSQIENIFKGIDSEVDNSTQRLENNKKKAAKVLNEIQRFNKEIESIKSDKKICLFKRTNEKAIEENKKFVTEIQSFLSNQLEKTKSKSALEMENFSTKCKEFNKNIQNYESSVANTILSGIPNICMRIRRFKKYYFQSTRYFKSSSISMKTTHTVNLAGFGICGLFFNKTNTKDIDLEIKLFEVESLSGLNVSNMPLISSIRVKVPIISNIIDPTFQFYLKNAVTINKDKFYVITIANVSEFPYIDIWTGEARDSTKQKTDEENDYNHSVTCNNSGVKFSFKTSIGLESDFNEIIGGLLSDVIFSHFE